MKILYNAFFIQINILLLKMITIECLKLGSNTKIKTEEKSTIKSNAKNSYELKFKAKNKKSAMNSQSSNKNTLTNSLKKTNVKLNSSFGTKALTSSKLTTTGCNPLCTQCSFSDKNYCTVCKTGVILFGFSCVETCPLGTFLNKANGSCSSCHQECPICWGPESDNCGTVFGKKAQVVNLESEIIDFFKNHIFIKDEVDQWLSALKSIFRDPKDEIIYPLFSDDNPEFSVYLDEKGKIEIPIGSFAFESGIFVPIPPYINREKKLIESHWIYKKGTWDGSAWHDEFYSRLPTFIQYKGSKDKIYIENNGMWVFDITSQWVFIKTVANIQPKEIIFEKLNYLNKIKFDVKIILIKNF